MNTSNSDKINGYDLVQVKNALPQIIKCSTKYKEFSKLSQLGNQETLLNIIITTIKRIRRYQNTKVIDLARLVKLLGEVQKHDSIQIKYNGKQKFDFPSGETTQLLFNTLNKGLATIYPPEKMMQFYNFLYAELLWSEDIIKSPVNNNDTQTLIFEYNASKSYKRIVKFEDEDDIDIRLYLGYKFKDNVTPYYAKNSNGESIQPIGLTLKGVKTILAIESALQKRKNSHYTGALLYTLGTEFQRAGIYEIKTSWFTNEQSAFLYDVVGILGVIDEEFNIEYNAKEKQIFVRKEIIKYNKYIKK